jgi:outer membrane receptor protein involved in Fe transport
MDIFTRYLHIPSLYTNPHFEAIVGSPIYGNANLKPEKTVSYEVGLQQQLTENLAFNNRIL